jgi:hypothetical protein
LFHILKSHLKGKGREVGDIQGQEEGEEERKGGYMWKGLEGKMGLFGLR